MQPLLTQALSTAVPIVEGRLYYVTLPSKVIPPMSTRECFFWSTDNELVYRQFFADFGPLNLGHVISFARKLKAALASEDYPGQKLYYYSSEHAHLRSNAAVLILAFKILSTGCSAEEAYLPFFALKPPLMPYRDAAFGTCSYHLPVLECARAIAKATDCKHLDLNGFDLDGYKHYDLIEHGDINWIIPGKFLAFSGPLNHRRDLEDGKTTLIVEDYVPIFKRMGVACVIRFNKKCYDRRKFVAAGIKHVDLYYEDGGNPTEAILQKFLAICEKTRGAIAVHCKAGLGRTGTNIALYMMKHYGYTAAETIAWCRVCRPGSIVGPQQQFVTDLEQRMFKEGEEFRGLQRQSTMQQSGPGRSEEPGLPGATHAATAAAAAAAFPPPGAHRRRNSGVGSDGLPLANGAFWASTSTAAGAGTGGSNSSSARRPMSSPYATAATRAGNHGGGSATGGDTGAGVSPGVPIHRRRHSDGVPGSAAPKEGKYTSAAGTGLEAAAVNGSSPPPSSPMTTSETAMGRSRRTAAAPRSAGSRGVVISTAEKRLRQRVVQQGAWDESASRINSTTPVIGKSRQNTSARGAGYGRQTSLPLRAYG